MHMPHETLQASQSLCTRTNQNQRGGYLWSKKLRNTDGNDRIHGRALYWQCQTGMTPKTPAVREMS
ncbi:hypothetical protein EXN66_Car020710 [Channa argus]|uniref:Uncharacterized protein n=1 Tax=Channa argus TaxID=215402 RepID=A0A6G1QRR6_CHAAH|nr:hypothetical protein EXN66_Car020710 [Channa argus]